MAWADTSRFHPQSASLFFRLPREIRENIYYLVLGTHCDEDNPYPRDSDIWRPDLTGPRRIYGTALLRTCRAVYMETWDRPILDTTLVIHEGSHQDRPQPKRIDGVMYHVRPSKPSFHLQAWHCLLLQRMDLTFQQIRLEGNGLEDWIRRVEFKKRHARRMMHALAEMADERIEKHGGQPRVKEFVESRLMPLGLRSIVVRINRMDWWRWTDEPIPEGDKLDAATAKGQVLKLPQPKLLFHPETGGDTLVLPGDEFEFKLILETWGPKVPQLNRVVAHTTQFTFDIPRDAGEDDGGNENSIQMRTLTWDGNAVHLKWKDEGGFEHRWKHVGDGWEDIHRCVVRFT